MDWENEPPSMVAERAARRAIEAISRVGTLTSDLASAKEEIEHLKAKIDDLQSILVEALTLIEAR